jgi:hypothetical protein
MSHMLDVELFGLEPVAHHRVNLLLHLVASLLLYAAWLRMTRAPVRSARGLLRTPSVARRVGGVDLRA